MWLLAMWPCHSVTASAHLVQTARGKQQANDAGYKIRHTMERDSGNDYQLYFYTSPYKRSYQTYEGIRCTAGSRSAAYAAELVTFCLLAP
jgi:hypothetical protein